MLQEAFRRAIGTDDAGTHFTSGPFGHARVAGIKRHEVSDQSCRAVTTFSWMSSSMFSVAYSSSVTIEWIESARESLSG